MGILSTTQIIKGLKQGRPIAPFFSDEKIIDQFVEEVSKQQMILQTTAPEVTQLFHRLKPQLDFISLERKQALLECDLFVLPFSIWVGYADELNGKPIIVISQGMIDLIANTIMASVLQGELPKELDSYYMFPFRKDMPASHLVTNALFLMQLNFYKSCKPLPNIVSLLSVDMLKQSRDAINGALLFVLFHELGHHKLGHLENETIRPMRYSTTINEELSIEQHQEMDADNFALESLIEQAQIFGSYWHQNAINFFMQMEQVSGNPSGFEHPLAINRAFYSDLLRSNIEENYDISPRKKFFDKISNRYLSTQHHTAEKANELIETPYDTCMNVLKEVNHTLAMFNIDISPLWLKPSPHWLDIEID